MPEYRRPQFEDGTYFFTVVTFQRKPIFYSPEARALLRAAWTRVQDRLPFTTPAICLLPDHLHCIWTLPEGDSNYSLRWGEIKRLFTKEYLRQIGPGGPRNESRRKRGEAAIWQRRFWEHAICDESDYRRHVDYIHYNPVKHNLAQDPGEWTWSSYRRYVEMGVYHDPWPAADIESVIAMNIE